MTVSKSIQKRPNHEKKGALHECHTLCLLAPFTGLLTQFTDSPVGWCHSKINAVEVVTKTMPLLRSWYAMESQLAMKCIYFLQIASCSLFCFQRMWIIRKRLPSVISPTVQSVRIHVQWSTTRAWPLSRHAHLFCTSAKGQLHQKAWFCPVPCLACALVKLNCVCIYHHSTFHLLIMIFFLNLQI